MGSRCCGVGGVVRRRVRLVSGTGLTYREAKLTPVVSPVQNNASNYRLDFHNLPYPSVNAKTCNCRKPCRRVSTRDVSGIIGVVVRLIEVCSAFSGRG